MADRYYQMAETMNQRGAMELAVPFYRQAVALLLAEREALQRELGADETATSHGIPLPTDALKGLFEAAEVLNQESTAGETAPPATTENKELTTDARNADLEAQISELSDELNADSAKQVMAGLQSMAESNRQSLPASGIALLAKAQTLLGLHQEALRSFEAALKMDPTNRSYQINFGAARLAAGNLDGGLKQLRTVWNSGLDNLDSETLGALFRNLSTAEAKNNHPLEALQLRRHWMRWNPQGATPKRWLTWAQRGINAHQTDARLFQESLDFLKDLHAAFPSDRSIKTALAETLEEAGNYREAALLFRDLLKTS